MKKSNQVYDILACVFRKYILSLILDLRGLFFSTSIIKKTDKPKSKRSLEGRARKQRSFWVI